MNPRNVRLWIALLRTTQFKQQVGQLGHECTNGRCALGVACEAYVQDGNVLDWNYLNASFLPKVVQEWAGVSSLGYLNALGNSVFNLNDIQLVTFEEIADLLEAELVKQEEDSIVLEQAYAFSG
jgi:hypothetical protein